MRQSEKLLIESINAKDKKAIEIAFHRFYSPLCFFANKIVREKEVSRDIVQDVFARLFEKSEYRFTNIFSLQSFLYNSVRNGAVDYLRQQKNRNVAGTMNFYPDDHSLPSEQDLFNISLETDIFEKIFEAIENLPTESKRIFKMSYIDHLSVKEISQRLRIAESTVKTQRQRAKKQLREALADLYTILAFLFFT